MSLTCSRPCRARVRCVVCVSRSSLSSPAIDWFDTLSLFHALCGLSSLLSLVIDRFDSLPRSRTMCGLLTRHRYRRRSLTGSTPCCPCAQYAVCHSYHRLSLTGSTPCRARTRCVVCVSMTSLSSLVIDVFETLPRSCAMCGLFEHVIAVSRLARYVWSVLPLCRYRRLSLTCSTLCRRAHDVWSVLACHRYRRLSLAFSTPCRARAPCVVCVSTSSLSSLVIDVFETLPRSRAVLCVSTSSILSLVIDGFDTLPRPRAMCGLL